MSEIEEIDKEINLGTLVYFRKFQPIANKVPKEIGPVLTGIITAIHFNKYTNY